jgi:hypothetical protein
MGKERRSKEQRFEKKGRLIAFFELRHFPTEFRYAHSPLHQANQFPAIVFYSSVIITG